MYQPINQVRLRGFLTESVRLFVSRSGQPRIAFRMEVWIDDENLPPKKPAGADYFSVVAFGTAFVNLLPRISFVLVHVAKTGNVLKPQTLLVWPPAAD